MKQKSVALSLAEAEYMAASMAACEGMWLRKLLFGLFECSSDNQSGIKLSENPVFHDRSKQIYIRYHFLRDCVQRGTIRLEYIQTNEQVADIFTQGTLQTQFCEVQG